MTTSLAAPVRRPSSALECCPPKPALAGRRLLGPAQAAELAQTFKVLANDTRLRLLHSLCRAGELCVMELSKAVAMKPQAISNQLQRLADQGIVESRRAGNNIYYRVIDPCVLGLLDQGLCLAEDARRRKP